MNSIRENKIIHLIYKFQHSKSLLFRYIANMVRISFENDGFCYIDNTRAPIGPLLKDNFPQRIRVNRHHRGKFIIDKPFTNALSAGEDGEKRITSLRYPARISKIQYKIS